MENTLRIAAIDIGANKVVGAISEKYENTFHILAIEEETTKIGTIHRGTIISPQDAAHHIVNIIRKLKNRTRTEIHKIYLTIHNDKDISSNEEWAKLLKDLKERGIHVINQDENTQNRLDLLASTIMSQTEQEIGCLLIEFGASCTSYILKGDNSLKCNTGIIPLGSHNITKDLTFLGIDLNNAEKLKLKLGTAIPKKVISPNAHIILEKNKPIEEAKYTTPLELSNMIEDRLKDIFYRFIIPLKEMQVFDNPARSIILVGGGAYLKDFAEWISNETGLMVKIEEKFSFVNTADDVNIRNAKYASIISTLYNGTEDYRTKSNDKVKKPSKLIKILESFSDKGMTSIFGKEQPE